MVKPMGDAERAQHFIRKMKIAKRIEELDKRHKVLLEKQYRTIDERMEIDEVDLLIKAYQIQLSIFLDGLHMELCHVLKER